MKNVFVVNDEVEVVYEHSENITSSHFFPPEDDPKMVRAVNELNENQTEYSRRGKTKDTSRRAGVKFYDTVCLRSERIGRRTKEGKVKEIGTGEGWQAHIPVNVKQGVASHFVARRGLSPDEQGN